MSSAPIETRSKPYLEFPNSLDVPTWDTAISTLFAAARQEVGFVSLRKEPGESETHKAQKGEILHFLGVPETGYLPVERTFMADGLSLSRSKRLNELCQIAPAVQRIFGLDFTRGRHTAESMISAARILTHAAVDYPELFDELAAPYASAGKRDKLPKYADDKVKQRVKSIMEFLEFMRRHDEYTLPFQGALHGMVIGAGAYSEDDELLVSLAGEQDQEEAKFYSAYGLNREVVRQIAHDAVYGSSTIAMILKGKTHDTSPGVRIPSADTISYTTTDAMELTRVFSPDPNAPLLERLAQTFSKVKDYAWQLATGNEEKMYPNNNYGIMPHELFDAQMVTLESVGSRIEFVYDPAIVYPILTHVGLRYRLSGAPWIRGPQHLERELIGNYLNAHYSADGGIAYLQQATEADLMRSIPELEGIPTTGWFYSKDKGVFPAERFTVYDYSDTWVRKGGKTVLFSQAFPAIYQTIHALRTMPPVYARHAQDF